MNWRCVGTLLAVAMFGGTAARAQAGAGRCDIELRPANDSLRLTSTTTTPNGPRNVFIGGRVEARCLNQDVRLLADSAEWYQGAQVLYLIGHVRYTEPRVRVTSDQMNYFQVDERLVATGNVEATLPSGSIMRGPQATYYRAVKGFRPVSRLEALQRPRLWLAQRDTSGKASEPVQVTANQITTENDSLVYAGGQVEITRSDLDAQSDSAFLDSGNELARLMRKPVVIGKGERNYTLHADQIELYTKNRIVQRVLSQGTARATSTDMLLTGDTIDLRVDQNKAQAAYIWGKSRARAVSPDRDLIADSLAVRMPNQRLHEVRAFRLAVANTLPDTANIRSGEKDWLKGDTIFAYFDTLPRPRTVSADTATAKPQLRELQSIGHASARYQMATQTSTPSRPGINYSRGDRITVTMDSTGVSRVQIDEHAVGLYLEPVRDSTLAPPESQPQPDSTRPSGSTTIPTPTKPTPAATRPTAKPAATVPRTTPARP